MISADIAKERLVKEPKTLRRHTTELEELKVDYQQRIKAWLQVEEEERRSIAHEIHDLSQTLCALKINLSWVGRRIPKGEEPLQEKLQQISELNNSIIGAVKRISVELRPGVLDDLGLTAAIEWQVGYFRERTGIEYELSVEPADITPNGQIGTAIFRILQKILTNIEKQARATSVSVSLKRSADELYLKVIDNGEGITEDQIASGLTNGVRSFDRQSFGQTEIGERAHLFGGEVKISSNPGKGTTVTVNIPLNQKGGSLW